MDFESDVEEYGQMEDHISPPGSLGSRITVQSSRYSGIARDSSPTLSQHLQQPSVHSVPPARNNVKLRSELRAERDSPNAQLIKLVTLICIFFVDSYNISLIGYIGVLAYDPLDPLAKGAHFVAIGTVLGLIVGCVLFAFLAEHYGRVSMFRSTLIITALFSAACALAYPIDGSVYYLLVPFRLLLGLGIGGDYPLVACIAKESEWPSGAGRRLGLVYLGQGFGPIVCGGIILLLLAFHTSEIHAGRAAMLFPLIPLFASAIPRLHMKEGREYFRDQADERLSSRLNSLLHEQWKQLLGTSLSWFFLDLYYYGISLYTPTVISSLGCGVDHEDACSVRDIIEFQVIISALSFPGYIFSAVFSTRISQYYIQAAGFCMCGLVFGVLAIFYGRLSSHRGLFMGLFVIIHFFSNFGPNFTTFSIPASTFSIQHRSLAVGLSAGVGHVGALIALFVFEPLLQWSIRAAMLGSSVAAILGLLSTLLFISRSEHGHMLEEKLERQSLTSQTNLIQYST